MSAPDLFLPMLSMWQCLRYPAAVARLVRLRLAKHESAMQCADVERARLVARCEQLEQENATLRAAKATRAFAVVKGGKGWS